MEVRKLVRSNPCFALHFIFMASLTQVTMAIRQDAIGILVCVMGVC